MTYRNDVIHALDRTKRRRVMRLVDERKARHGNKPHESAPFVRIAAGSVKGHPDRPFEGERDGACGGRGMPCPQCNASDDDTEPRAPKGFKTEVDKKGWRH